MVTLSCGGNMDPWGPARIGDTGFIIGPGAPGMNRCVGVTTLCDGIVKLRRTLGRALAGTSKLTDRGAEFLFKALRCWIEGGISRSSGTSGRFLVARISGLGVFEGERLPGRRNF